MNISGSLLCLALWGVSQAAFASDDGGFPPLTCERHFYNNSDGPWLVAPSGNIGCNGQKRGVACNVLPNTTITLQYYGTLNQRFDGDPQYADSSIALIAQNYYFDKFNRGKPLTVTEGCAYLLHSGSTGNVVLNGPANGDITTCGVGTYACSKDPGASHG